ncbi:MAG: GDP-mannose 4,6-dehydratase [Christensenellaceae bacterium]|nr:GDP-mannose 4,6-dehydratase [Christensenellaceae bacterium]
MAVRSLIIGGAGFVGGHLMDRLILSGDEVTATKLESEKISRTDVKTVNMELTDIEDVRRVINEELPDRIYHLAAVSSVALSWKQPHLTVDVNIKGAINLLEAVKDCEKKIKVLMIGSGEEYGAVSEKDLPVDEETALHPGNMYAVTKICQNMISSLYAKAYGMDVMMVRAFNHCGPAQAPMFVVSDFARQIAEAEKGLREPVMYVGNLSAKRDFTDVRDVVKAYELIMQHGTKGETYNVGSGNARSIDSLLKMLVSFSTIDIDVKIDEKRLRPVDVPVIEADTSKLKAATGWQPSIPMEQTLKDTLEYWRNNV